jgi:hypothetical protein
LPIDSRIPQCQHIKFDGIRCGSPAMRGAANCYFHLRPARSKDISVPEVMDHRTRQKVLSQIINALVNHEIEPKRATAMINLIKLSAQCEREALIEEQLRRLSPARTVETTAPTPDLQTQK